MMRYVLFAILFLVGNPALAEQSAPPTELKLDVIIEPRHVLARGAYVQGQIRLRIQLTSPDAFEEFHLDIPEIQGARVLTLVSPSTRQVQHYGLVGYAHETRLALFPERSGNLTIPPISITGVLAPSADSRRAFDLQNPAAEINVRAMDPALPGDWWLVSEEVSLEESWTPEPMDFRVGATVQRHVTLTANGVTTEQLPTLKQKTSPSYAVVGVRTEKVTTRTKDGVVSQLSQTWDLRIQSSDVFTISPISVAYWDPAADQPAIASSPPLRVEPLVEDPAAERRALIGAAESEYYSRQAGVIALVAMPAVAAAIVMALIFLAVLPTRADRRLKARCTVDATAEDVMAAILDWAQGGFGWQGSRAFAYFHARLETAAVDVITNVQKALYAPRMQPLDPPKIARILTLSARRQRLQALWSRMRSALAQYIGSPSSPGFEKVVRVERDKPVNL